MPLKALKYFLYASLHYMQASKVFETQFSTKRLLFHFFFILSYFLSIKN